MHILSLQSGLLNQRFNINKNFEDLNKLKHGVLSRNAEHEALRPTQSLEQRLNIRNYSSHAQL